MYESKGLSFSIGRSSKNDFVVEDIPQNQTVSGHHAVIYEKCYYQNQPQRNDAPVEVRFFLIDNSTNGTYVNGAFVHNAEVEIHMGDNVTLGKNYVLDVSDFLQRYFSGSKTKTKQQAGGTTREPQPQQPIFIQPQPQAQPQPIIIQQQPQQPKSGTIIRTHSSKMGLAILCLIFGSILCGIIAIVYASKSNNLYQSAMATSDSAVRSNLYAESEKANSTAQTWIIVGFIIAVLQLLLFFV